MARLFTYLAVAVALVLALAVAADACTVENCAACHPLADSVCVECNPGYEVAKFQCVEEAGTDGDNASSATSKKPATTTQKPATTKKPATTTSAPVICNVANCLMCFAKDGNKCAMCNVGLRVTANNTRCTRNGKNGASASTNGVLALAAVAVAAVAATY